MVAASRPADPLRNLPAQENRRRSSPSRPHDLNQQPGSHNGQHRRQSPAGGRADAAAGRRPDYPRADISAHARADYPGPRADILADGRAGQRKESPHRHRPQDPSARQSGIRHSSPAGHITDQFSRQARNESPSRGYRRDEHEAPPFVARSDAGQPMRRDDSPKVVMPSSSDIILRPAMPPSSDKKPPALSRK